MKNFALIGAAGYIAPRHLQAIRDTGNKLVAAFDKSDSVGILDAYFPEADFFLEFERFDRHLEKLKRQGNAIDFIVVASPNYLHDAHIRFGLRYGADVICEKPLVINPWNANALLEMESETGKRVYPILQLRLHPVIQALKERINTSKRYDIDLTYITSRGKWYFSSWKGDESKSGGIATNIGIHFFDMLISIFGPVQEVEVHRKSHDSVAGKLVLEKADVRWFLSINADHLPPDISKHGKRTYRNILIDGEALEFSDGFTELHTHSYQNILDGTGFSVSDALPSIDMVHRIRQSDITDSGDKHAFADLPQSAHPFSISK